ncbi:MAG: hypothetical protein ABIW82_15645 [Dokdonella sp.]
MDLSAYFDVTPPNPLPISAVAFTAQIANTGPTCALYPVLTFTFPPSTTSATTTSCVEDPDGVPTCILPTLLAGDIAAVKVDATYSGGDGEIATVTAATASQDTVTANDAQRIAIQKATRYAGLHSTPHNARVIDASHISSHWLVTIHVRDRASEKDCIIDVSDALANSRVAAESTLDG